MEISVSLDQHCAAFIEAEVAAGHYESADEVVASALRLLEAKGRRIHDLRTALITGEVSGSPTPFNFDDFLQEKRELL